MTRSPTSGGDLGLAAVQLSRTDEGGLLIQAPNALALRNLIERSLVWAGRDNRVQRL